jgi:hypothetical protein
MIERATLLKLARDTAAQRMAARRSLISAYLTGSVAANEPLLGDAADIDLILIDFEPPLISREVIRLSDQVALDIQTRSKADYAYPKDLRVHPWRGAELCEPIFLHDPTHFFELVQSSVRGQFHRPDHVAARARTFAAWARDELHIAFGLPGAQPSSPVTLASFCRSLLYSANAVISLTGFPGAGRRLTMKLERAARALARPDLYDSFLAIFGTVRTQTADPVRSQLPDWSAAYRAGQSAENELIHPARRTIYEHGFQAQLESDRAADALWLMLYTWQACMMNLPGDTPHADRWIAFLQQLGMASPAEFAEKVQQAQAYMELVAETVETWAEKNGA